MREGKDRRGRRIEGELGGGRGEVVRRGNRGKGVKKRKWNERKS